MKTEPLFEKFNETDVREEIIAPLLRLLGYRSGSQNDVIREQPLRYPFLTIGRKNPNKDPKLRGKADYILEIQNRLRWVLEAKPPEPIRTDDIEQAWTYASHPEIRAIFFALCNGRTWTVYRTIEGPNAPPVMALTYEQLQTEPQRLANLLGPEALIRDFPNVEVDVGLPIAPGLRSLARITNGFVRYTQSNLAPSIFGELQNGITRGSVERDERGHLVVFVEASGPTRSIQEFNERLGLSKFEMISESAQLSTELAHPTVFVYENQIILPAGERVLNPATWQHVTFPCNITCNIKTQARGIFHDSVLSGSFDTVMAILEMQQTVKLSGVFEVHLA
jgi:hypothetical protein